MFFCRIAKVAYVEQVNSLFYGAIWVGSALLRFFTVWGTL